MFCGWLTLSFAMIFAVLLINRISSISPTRKSFEVASRIVCSAKSLQFKASRFQYSKDRRECTLIYTKEKDAKNVITFIPSGWTDEGFQYGIYSQTDDAVYHISTYQPKSIMETTTKTTALSTTGSIVEPTTTAKKIVMKMEWISPNKFTPKHIYSFWRTPDSNLWSCSPMELVPFFKLISVFKDYFVANILTNEKFKDACNDLCFVQFEIFRYVSYQPKGDQIDGHLTNVLKVEPKKNIVQPTQC